MGNTRFLRLCRDDTASKRKPLVFGDISRLGSSCKSAGMCAWTSAWRAFFKPGLCPHSGIRVRMDLTVIWKQRTDAGQWHVLVVRAVVPGQY